jgi:hypothetical protein
MQEDPEEVRIKSLLDNLIHLKYCMLFMCGPEQSYPVSVFQDSSLQKADMGGPQKRRRRRRRSIRNHFFQTYRNSLKPVC